MFIFLTDVNPKVGLIEVFVVSGRHRITAYWMPKKFPHKARIDKIVRGPALDFSDFTATCVAVAASVGEAIKGKTWPEIRSLIGQCFVLDGVEVETAKTV